MLKKFLILSIVPLALMAAPQAPSNLKLIPHTNSVDISWSDNSQDESGFKIFRDDHLISIVPQNVTSYTDIGLKAGTTYKYTIKATDDDITNYIISNISAQIDADTITFKVDGHLRDDFHIGFYIDSDNNPGTGYSRGVIKGADYLVQSNGLYRYPEGAQGWHWDRVEGVNTNNNLNKNSSSFTIKLAQLENHAKIINFLSEVSTKDWKQHFIYKNMKSVQLSNDGDSQHLPKYGNVKVYSTMRSIGFEWEFNVDPNKKANCLLKFRKVGEKNWLDAWHPYRISHTPSVPVAGKNNPFDGCAGSIFFLKPSTEYEIKIVLNGENGLHDDGIVKVRTQSEPKIADNAPKYYVIPGNGGGRGTVNEPYRGIKEALEHAHAGDIFLLKKGIYSGEVTFNVNGSEGHWIVWKALEDGVVFDDAIWVSGSYNWFEGIHFRGDPNNSNDFALRTEGSPNRVVVRKNRFTDYFYSIDLNRGGTNWLIEDNTIIGNKDVNECLDNAGNEIHSGNCPDSSWEGEGIELQHTAGHTVRYNSISHVADGISYPLENVDIYGNEIFDVTDDGIEPDYGYANIRVWQNRITNVRHNGFSFQPMNGGPWYFIRNQIMAPLESTLKLYDLSKVLLANNLLVGWRYAVLANGDTQGLRNIDSFNNIYISASGNYSLWEQRDDGEIEAKLDYDGFELGKSDYNFRWGNETYSDLLSFKNVTGLEQHGVVFNTNECFTSFHPRRSPDRFDFEFVELKNGCNLIDAGVYIPNVSGDFSGKAPDIGVYEKGLQLPHFGVR